MFHLPRMRITRPYRTSVALEEERLWVGFYRRVGNPAIAAEVIQHLDGDADQKRTHPALYLRCKESLRKKKARQARTKRIRSFMRRILDGLLRNPSATCARNCGIAPASSSTACRNRCASLPSKRAKAGRKRPSWLRRSPMAGSPTLRALPRRVSTPVQRRHVTSRQRERFAAMSGVQSPPTHLRPPS